MSFGAALIHLFLVLGIVGAAKIANTETNNIVLRAKSPEITTAEVATDNIADRRRRAIPREMKWEIPKYCGYSNNLKKIQELIDRYGIKDVAKAQETHGEGWHCLHFAAAWKRTEMIKLLVENGADIDPKTAKGFRGKTPLNVAMERCKYKKPAESGTIKTITTLIRLGASVDKAEESRNGKKRLRNFCKSMKQQAKEIEAAIAGQAVEE